MIEVNECIKKLKQQREASRELFRIKAQIDSVLKEQKRIQEQRAEQQKKDQMNREGAFVLPVFWGMIANNLFIMNLLPGCEAEQ